MRRSEEKPIGKLCDRCNHQVVIANFTETWVQLNLLVFYKECVTGRKSYQCVCESEWWEVGVRAGVIAILWVPLLNCKWCISCLMNCEMHLMAWLPISRQLGIKCSKIKIIMDYAPKWNPKIHKNFTVANPVGKHNRSKRTIKSKPCIGLNKKKTILAGDCICNNCVVV